MKGLPPHLLMGLLLVLEESLKSRKLRGHVGVYLKIALDNLFHLAYIVVHVLIHNCRRLHARYDFALLCQQLSCFLEVLQVVLLKLLVFVEDVVDLLVER